MSEINPNSAPGTGRPSGFNQAMADKICLGLMEGRSLKSICRDENMPTHVTVFNWLQAFPNFFNQYREAREIQAETLADEIQDIADDGLNDYVEVQKKNGAVILCDQENIQRSKLRFEARKWIASKLLPKKYGDKVAHTGEGGGPIVFKVEKIGE